MFVRRALLFVVLGACGDGSVLPDAAPPSVTLTLGTVDASGAGFFPLAGDQPLVPGAQSGFHVWLKYRVAGDMPATVRVRRTAHRVRDNALILLTEGVQDIDTSGDGVWELPTPIPAFMCPTPIGTRVRDELVRFTVQLLDVQDGHMLVESSAEATPRCPTDNQLEFCERICSG